MINMYSDYEYYMYVYSFISLGRNLYYVVEDDEVV